MDESQFALTIIIITALFLAFALALTAVARSDRSTQSNILKLFNGFLKRLPSLFRK